MKRWHYGDPPDLSPWMDAENWPCLNKSHCEEVETQVIADDGEIEMDTRKCAVCGLTVQYYDDDYLHVHGYLIAGRRFNDLESVRAHGEGKASP